MKKKAMHPNDWQLIRSYLLGGAGIGAGAGLVTSLVNQVKDLKREADDDNALDKDVLTLNVRAQPKTAATAPANESTSFTRAPIALVGSLLAGAGAYAGVRKLHQYLKKREMADQLSRAQNAYIDLVQQEGEAVKAGAFDHMDRKGMSRTESVSAIPLTIALLTGLSSAAVTNQVLKKSFPDRQSATRIQPKKVVIKRDTDGDNVPDEEQIVPYSKVAAANLAETAYSFRSGESDIEDMVCAAAAGRLPEMRKMATEFGSNALLQSIRGAARFQTSTLRAKMACHALVNDPELGPTTELLAAAEFLERAPMFAKMAAGLDRDSIAAMLDYHTKLAWAQHEQATVPALEALIETSGEKSAAAQASQSPEQVALAIQQMLAMSGEEEGQLPTTDIPGVDAATLQTPESETSPATV